MPLPGNVDLIEVTAEFKYIDASVPVGTVEFSMSGNPWLKDGSANAILLPKTVVCTLNASGVLVGPAGAVGTGGVGVKLPATNDVDLVPSGFVYDIVIKITGLPEQAYSISLPTGTSPVDLADLAPVSPVDGSGVPVVTTVNGISPNSAGALTLTAAQVPGALTYKAPVVLTDGPTIATDVSLSNVFRVELAGNRTLSNPSNPVDGQVVRWEIKQDGSGSRTLTLGAKFVFGTDLPAITLSTIAAKVDVLGAQYHQASDTWRVVAFAKGF